MNIAKAEEQIRLGRMTSAGLAAFERRDPARSSIYSFEQTSVALDGPSDQLFKRNEEAWAFFQAQPGGYRKVSLHWVTSAKRPATRAKRLAKLIDASASKERIYWI